MSLKQTIRAALSLLGIDRLVLAIHDHCFPSLGEEETGRGTPYSQGGRRFTSFVSDLGFTGIQFGPQGKTSLTNPSPYDSSLLSKNELSISLLSLAQDEWQNLLAPIELVSSENNHRGERDRNSYKDAWLRQHAALRKAHSSFTSQKNERGALWSSYRQWVEAQFDWLERESLFEALTVVYNTDDWRRWAQADQELFQRTDFRIQRSKELQKSYQQEIDFFSFCQFVVHRQHQQYRELSAQLNLKLYGDMQIGFSHRDVWSLQSLFLPNYCLGAPPSRTNPDGQPWGYPVLHPELYSQSTVGGERIAGPVLNWLIARVDKLLQDFDGLRVDHPHGLVCPWIYKATEHDLLRSVQQGARLFDSPDLADHPELHQYAIARPDQINHAVPRYSDCWVETLTDAQVKQYGILVESITDRIKLRQLNQADLIWEILSSCPYPLQRVLQRYGLGRLRVTQKSDPFNSNDIYRSDNAQPADWIMVGTHDTKPVWLVVEQWNQTTRAGWADYLANRLATSTSERTALVEQLATDTDRLVEALFADLFLGPARNVSIFFADLFGMTEVYNQPGVTNETNWMLSVPSDYEVLYRSRVRHGKALNLARVLSMALRAKSEANSSEAAQLAAKLDTSELSAV